MIVEKPSSRDPLTVGEALKKATAYLESKGRESSRLSAELLLAHVLGTDRLHVYLRFEAPMEQSEVAQMRELLARRGKGEPVAYILGTKEFMGLAFEVSHSVLIPRPDTETLVTHVARWIGSEGQGVILDVGTGSGNIIVSLLHDCPFITGVGIDCSPEALEVAGRNAGRHGVKERLELFCSSLYSNLPSEYRNRFDWIISNPPYICEDEWDSLAVEIREYEPRLALLAGKDGLAVYEPLIREAREWLKPGGGIALEISSRTLEGVQNLLRQSGFGNIQVLEDLGRQPRAIIATEGV